MYPEGTTIDDIKMKGTVDKKLEGRSHCGSDFIYLATFPRGEIAQNTRIYLRDVMGIQCIATGRDVEKIYILKKTSPRGTT
jgi:hypothetical protein